MSSEQRRAPCDAFALSRVGATAELAGCQLAADRVAGPAHVPGLHLSAHCGGQPLRFWVSEAQWCTWLAPQLAAPSLAQIAPEWLPMLAAWTLSPLDGWLQEQGLGALSEAAVAPAVVPAADPAEAPAGGWRLTLSDGARQLSLWVQQASPEKLHALLAALAPSPEQVHDLALGLGWCVLMPEAWRQVGVGDALPIVGMADTLDTLWLHPDASPGRLRLHDTRHAEVTAAPLPPADEPHGALRLCVEVGRARVAAPALAAWVPGMALELDARAHTLLRLSTHERLWAQGQLLRLDDAWAVRIVTLAD